MKLLAILISILALIFAYKAFEATRSLPPAPQTVSRESKSTAKGEKQKSPGVMKDAGRLVEDLGHWLSGD